MGCNASKRKNDPVLEQAEPVTEGPHFPCIEIDDEDMDQAPVDPASKIMKIYNNVYGDG